MRKWSLPIAFASAFFLHLVRIGVDVAILGEETRKVLGVVGSTVSETSMVTVVLLVGASH